MTFTERVKEIRNDSGLNQSDFAASLGLTRDAYANFEYDRLKNPNAKEPTIKAICKEFSVNEEWLRTGEGEKYIPVDSDDAILAYDLLEGLDDPVIQLIKDIMNTYRKLGENEKKVLKQYVEDLREEMKKDRD